MKILNYHKMNDDAFHNDKFDKDNGCNKTIIIHHCHLCFPAGKSRNQSNG